MAKILSRALSLLFSLGAPLFSATYSEDVAPILERHCVACHRPGEIGPMPLRTFAEVRPWAQAISASVSSRRMPPWHANSPAGHFSNDRRLNQAEIATLRAWAKQPLPGPPRAPAAAPSLTDGWGIGAPSLVVSLPAEQKVSASGPDEYVKILVDPHLEKDLWVQAVEFRPGNRKIVHHAHVFLQLPHPPSSSRRRAPSPFVLDDGLKVIDPAAPALDDGCSHPDGGYIIGRDHGDTQALLASFVPGMSPAAWPPGVAKRIPAGSKFLFDIHYAKVTGRPETDLSQVGFVLAQAPPKRALERLEASNFYFSIPPGAPAHRVTACVTLPYDADLLGLLGHMHYRGKAFRIWAEIPGRPPQILLDVPRYDFEWQEMYRFARPPRLPQGTVVKMEGWFDNSPNNPANPNPQVAVRWGEHTRTEMMDAWLEFVPATARP